MLGFIFMMPTLGMAQNATINISVPKIHKLLDQDNEGAWQGPLLSVFNVIQDETRKPVEFKVLPFPRIVQLLKTGETDFGFFIESEKRSQIAHLVQRLQPTYFVLVSKKGSAIKTVDDLEGKILGISKRGVASSYAEKLKQGSLYQFSSHKGLMNALLAGRIDVFLTPDFRYVELMETNNLSYEDFEILTPFAHRFFALYVSKQYAEQNKQVFEKLKKIKGMNLAGFGIDTLKEHYLIDLKQTTLRR